jgi:hypothetical protein
VYHGLLNVPDSDRHSNTFFFERNFPRKSACSADGTVETKSTELSREEQLLVDPKRFFDVEGDQLDQESQELLNKLKQDVLENMPADKVASYDLSWGPGVDPQRDDHQAYLRNFCDKFCEVALFR